MIDRGADISTLSQFAGEKEILFAPLTGLEVVSAPRAVVIDGVDVLIVELRLSCNLHDETMEQVVGRMQRTHLTLLDSMRVPSAPAKAMSPIDAVASRAQRRGHHFFNFKEGFLAATAEAFEAQDAVLEALATSEAWESEVGDPAEVAARMRTTAEVLARRERHEAAAALLGLAIARCPAEASHVEAVEQWCSSWWYTPSTTQRHALLALSVLLKSGRAREPPWPQTAVVLAGLGGPSAQDHKKHGIVAERLCLANRVPTRLVRVVPIHEDATPRACKGSALLAAADMGDAEGIKAVLSLQPPPDVNEAVENGVTPLMLAARSTIAAVVVSLLDAGAQPQLASRKGVTALHLAASEGQLAVVEMLLARRAPVDTVQAGGVTPLLCAALDGHTAVVRTLLEHSADPDYLEERGFSALMFAAQGSHTEMAGLLLARGARVDVVVESDPSAPLGTALIGAARSGSVAIIQMLLEHKAFVDQPRGDGVVPLIQAAWNGRTAAIQALLHANANVNHVSHAGYSALMHASEGGFDEAVEKLLANGADVSLQVTAGDECGSTALSLAKKKGRAAVIPLLESSGSSLRLDVT